MVETRQIGPVWCHVSSLWKAAAVKADEIKIGSHESILYLYPLSTQQQAIDVYCLGQQQLSEDTF